MSDVEKIMKEKLAEEITTNVDEILLGDFKNSILGDDKFEVDPTYLHSIKQKVEKLLSNIIEHCKLAEYIDLKLRYRLSREKLSSSHLHELYEQQKDINGNQLRYGYDYIPDNFEEWLSVYVSDYFEVELIYGLMCSGRRIVKKDLIRLNEIAIKYGVS